MAFIFECQFILFSSSGLFSLPVIETIICNILGVFLLNFSNKSLHFSKKAKEINFNYFGDTVYNSKRIKERKDFYRLEKKRLMKKRFELEREVLQNEKEVEDLKKLLKEVVNTWNDEPNKSFLETVSLDGNLLQQFMFCKRR